MQHPAELEINCLIAQHLPKFSEQIEVGLSALEDTRSNRQKVYDFMNLPSYIQERRVRALGLYRDGDDLLTSDMLLPMWASRAREAHVLFQLFAERQSEE